MKITKYISIAAAILTAAQISSPCLGGDGRVMLISVSGEIELGLSPYVERLTSRAARENYDLIIYEINTFGGRLDAAVAIRDAIISSSVPTVSFINKRAISAGVLISLAAGRIYMHPNSTIGAAEPVAMGIGLSKGEVSEKVVSYWKAELRSTAERNDRPANVAEAFADKSIEIEGVVEEDKLLTLTTTQAMELGMADETAESIGDILVMENLKGATIVEPGMNMLERIAGFLTRGLVSSILLTAALLGIFFEIRTPGFGAPGIIALIALTLFFGSHSLVHLAGWGEILLFIFGAVMLLIEIFLIPGFGIVGTVGIIAIVASLYLSLIGRFFHPADFVSGVQVLAISFISAFVIILIALRFLPKFTPVNRLILSTTEDEAEGFRSSPAAYEKLDGMTGVALTTLRPSGTALIDGTKFSVVSDGDFIEKNARIRVVRIEGYRIVVEKS
jgi:membrane-bound serine protease (ClpP class)